MKATGPYVPLSSEQEIFARLGVAWCEPREREGKFSIRQPWFEGRPWFEGGLPTGVALQPLQLQALRQLSNPDPDPNPNTKPDPNPGPSPQPFPHPNPIPNPSPNPNQALRELRPSLPLPVGWKCAPTSVPIIIPNPNHP